MEAQRSNNLTGLPGAAIKSVLIIEDDLGQRPFWEVVMRRNFGEFNLDWAVSGEEAKRCLVDSQQRDQCYDLIITDLFLAGSETGLDMVSSIRQYFESVPIVLVSAVDDNALKELCNAGESGLIVLKKPLNIPTIERALFDSLAGKSFLDSADIDESKGTAE